MSRSSVRRSRIVLVMVATTLALAAFAAPVAAAPADGNGNRFVVTVEETGIPIPCGEETIWADISGWFQVREFTGTGNRNLDLAVFHFQVTYYNADGDTFTYLDVGPDRAYIDRNGDLIITITGRPGNAGGMGFALSGHMVINDTTGEAVWHGNTSPDADAQACAPLAG